MKLVFLCFIIGNILTGLITCQNDDCLVQTKLGQIQGKVEESRGGKKFCSFLGIPFANPPQRFQEAKLKDSWDGILGAQKLGAECAQLGQGAVVGDEDCLYVNVFVPIGDQCPLTQQQQQQDGNSTDNLASGHPVLVHIHGGSFTSGSGGLYGPKLWLDECVVYVSLNYRLGALGFLTTEDGLIPGNLGLKDQRLGLQWVQMNIPGFRGNPKMVTINGISAGACSVSHLVASTSAKGLFQRAIAQSGSAVNPWGIAKNPGGMARRLGQRLNCSGGNEDKNISTAALKSCLLSKDFKEIVVNQHKLAKLGSDFLVVPFGPVVERLTAKNAFHRINPYYKIKLGAFNKVPLIQGFCEDEAMVLQENKILVSQLNERWEELAPITLMYDEDYIPQSRKNEFSSKIRQFYFGGKNISEESLHNVTNMYSDRAFVQGIFENVASHARHAPAYPYVLTYKGAFSFAQLAGYKKPATSHGDDGQYFFNLDGLPPLRRGSADEKMSENLIKLWMSFIRTGEPSETFPTSNLWKQYRNTRSGDLWFQLDSATQEIPNYLQTRRDFWKNLGLNAYDYPMF